MSSLPTLLLREQVGNRLTYRRLFFFPALAFRPVFAFEGFPGLADFEPDRWAALFRPPPNSVSDRVLPSGSGNHAILAPLGEVQIP